MSAEESFIYLTLRTASPLLGWAHILKTKDTHIQRQRFVFLNSSCWLAGDKTPRGVTSQVSKAPNRGKPHRDRRALDLFGQHFLFLCPPSSSARGKKLQLGLFFFLHETSIKNRGFSDGGAMSKIGFEVFFSPTFNVDAEKNQAEAERNPIFTSVAASIFSKKVLPGTCRAPKKVLPGTR